MTIPSTINDAKSLVAYWAQRKAEEDEAKLYEKVEWKVVPDTIPRPEKKKVPWFAYMLP